VHDHFRDFAEAEAPMEWGLRAQPARPGDCFHLSVVRANRIDLSSVLRMNFAMLASGRRANLASKAETPRDEASPLRLN
jgi:hypothetical protein